MHHHNKSILISIQNHFFKISFLPELFSRHSFASAPREITGVHAVAYIVLLKKLGFLSIYLLTPPYCLDVMFPFFSLKSFCLLLGTQQNISFMIFTFGNQLNASELICHGSKCT